MKRDVKKTGVRGHPRYKKRYAQEIIKLAEKHTLVEIAVKWGVTRNTLINWANENPDFSWPHQRAKEINFAAFIAEGKAHFNDRHFNSRMWEHYARCIYMNELRAQPTLKDFSKASNKKKMNMLFRAFERGEMKSSELKEMIDAIRIVYEIQEGAELAKRLEDIEKRMR